ncbi:hypothetical protein BLNAU_12077 [Blattamonas nauphoetae]|uniref:DDE-1 domain-containing protein n=1 Tax=Blattamonas nauphoetae TaxID=2049346 RepID=A0ABQ9XR98_9EUKA|nr:hypothetical protein BLNAU_12077 [Blattamonas nauphoetae]
MDTKTTNLACVSLDGRSLLPYFVVPAPFRTYSMYEIGCVRGLMCHIKVHTYCNLTAALFWDWLETVLIPEVEFRRTMPNNENQEAVLIVDNCSIHILHVIDVAIFGTWKRFLRESRGIRADERCASIVSHCTNVWQRTVCFQQVIAAFAACGIRRRCVSGMAVVEVDKQNNPKPFGFKLAEGKKSSKVSRKPGVKNSRKEKADWSGELCNHCPYPPLHVGESSEYVKPEFHGKPELGLRTHK